MEFRFQRSKAGAILSGIAFIILGIVAFTHPANATLFLTEVTGWVLIVLGVCGLVMAFTHFSSTSTAAFWRCSWASWS